MLKIIPLVVLATTCFAGTGELEVRVRTTAAGPQIHVDGKPVPPRLSAARMTQSPFLSRPRRFLSYRGTQKDS